MLRIFKIWCLFSAKKPLSLRSDSGLANRLHTSMKVLKFGGTSVGSTESIRSVKKIVEAIEEPVIVVVSALGGITDKLLKTSELASKGDPAYQQELAEIVARHRNIIESVVPKAAQEKVENLVMETLDELENIFRGVFLIKDLSPKTSDTIVSYGISSRTPSYMTRVNLSRPSSNSTSISSISNRQTNGSTKRSNRFRRWLLYPDSFHRAAKTTK